MGLFSNPQVINDGTADRTFIFRGQIPSTNGSMVGEYIEPAAAIAEQSKLNAKHAETSSIVRSVIQRTAVETDAEGVDLGRVTWNLSATYSKKNTAAFVKKQGLIVINGSEVAGVLDNFLLKLI